ncbi:MAG: response regulator [Nitrosopumilus sp.]|nr:response regulator [Nitrosopumilus sp.]
MSNTESMKILIIDDNPTLLNVFAKLLEIKGFFVTAETTFKAGLWHLENESYDVLFVDSPLDDYTEKQILKLLKENHVFQKTNVFLFSSVDFDNVELDEWKKEGLYSYLKKPVKRNTIINALDTIRTKIFSTQILSKPEPENDQATTEQIEKLNQLQKQIEELETVPEPEPENDQATPEQIEKLNQLQKQIEELETVPEPEPENDQATTEQIEKLNQLQKQIEGLENTLHVPSFAQKDLELKKSINEKTKSDTNVLNFKNILNDLRSLQSKFEYAGQFTKKSSVEPNLEQNKIVENELEQILFEISEIKNELQLLDEMNDFELKTGSSLLNHKKKPKMTKKSASSGGKKPKMTKKSASSGGKKPKMTK